ncbi:carbohydrate kinase family protein [Candidatus Gottesmanbacteria bacterium]|nr:carbohydrate kinase family protein [Candidatus Gottesmanbacteria bacterium]
MILVTGSLAYDSIMDFPGNFSEHVMPEKVHILNVSFLVDKMHKGFGGTAGNIAYNLSLLGVKTTILAIVGADFAAYGEFLRQNEVDTSYIRTVNNLYTSNAFGITDKKDNQIWGFYTGADMLSDNLSTNEVKGKIDFGVIAPANPKAMIKFALEYQKKGTNYLFDPGMQLPWLSGADLKLGIKGAKIVIGNDYEISLMKKKMGLKETDSIGREDQIIITTLGEKGSIIHYKDVNMMIPAAVTRGASDPAGAGDAYRAGFIAGFMRGLDLEICGRMGSIASVYTVEKYGTTTHKYTTADFMRRYEENFGKKLDL